MSTKSLILGIGGQDGSYLAEELLARGHEVHGLYRRSSTPNLGRIAHILNRVTLHKGDLSDPLSLLAAVDASQTDCVYNMADQDDVRWSGNVPSYNVDVTAGAVANLLEIVKRRGIRMFQPVSSTMFRPGFKPMNEQSELEPNSVYACAKACAYHLTRYYRSQGVFASTAIMFNHDSPRRGPGYLLQRICVDAKRVANGDLATIDVGSPDTLVDIGYAKEYMTAVANIMELDHATDFVLGTGVGTSIVRIAQRALDCLGIDASKITAQAVSKYPVPYSIANVAKANKIIGFVPRTTYVSLIPMILGI